MKTKSSKLDLPECFNPTTIPTRSNKGYKSSDPTPSSNSNIVSDTVTTGSSVTTSPNHIESPTNQQVQKIIIENKREPTNLMFPVFYGAKAYAQYRTFCIAHAQANRHYSGITIQPTPTTLDFNPHMSMEDSRQLYMATFKSLGKEAQVLVSRDIAASADGFKLWQSLDDHFLKTATSIQSQDNLLADYEKARKESNESFIQYLARIEDKINKLEYNHIPSGDFKTKVYKLLWGLKMNNVFGDILMNFDSRPEWYAPTMSLRKVIMKAQTYHDEYVAIHGPLQPHNPAPRSRNRPNNNNPSPRNNDNGCTTSGTAPQARPPPCSRSSPAPSNTPSSEPMETEHGPIQSAIQAVKQELQSAPNPTAALFNIARQYHNTCPLHHNPRHSIIECYKLANVCQALNLFTEYNNVRGDLGYNSMPTRSEQSAAFRNPSGPTPQVSPPPSSNTCGRRVVFDVEEDSDSDDELQDGVATGVDAVTNTIVDNDTNDQVTCYSQCPHSPPPELLPTNPLLDTASSKIYTHCRHIPSWSTLTPNFLLKHNYIKAVIDSGASHSMSSHRSLFESITPFPVQHRPMAMMGDDSTTIPIHGYGIMSYTIHGHSIRTPGYYVLLLGATLLSVKQHIQFNGCMFHAEAQNTFLSYPTFDIYPTISDEIFVLLRPFQAKPNDTYNFDSQTAELVKIPQNTKSKRKLSNNLHLNLHPQTIDKYISSNTHRPFFTETVQLQKLIPQAVMPTRATKGSIGYDVHSITSHTIQPGQVQKIPTGLSTALPQGMYLRIASRSSLALKGLTVEGGVIDSDFRGEIQVLLRNHTSTPINISPQSKIAQFIFKKASTPYIHIVKNLSSSTRKGGFGSTDAPKNPPSRLKRYKINPEETLVIDTQNNMHYQVHNASATDPTPSSSSTDIVVTSLRKSKNKSTNDILHMANHPIDNSNTSLSSSTAAPPIPPSSTAVPAATPQVTTMTEAVLLQSIGYRKLPSLKKYLKSTSNKSFCIQKDVNPAISPGQTATMKSSRQNTTPLPIPEKVGDV
jgi:dUTP pyrophosphatase